MSQQVDPSNEHRGSPLAEGRLPSYSYDQLANRRQRPGSPERQRKFAGILCGVIALATCCYIFWITAVSAHNQPRTMQVPGTKSSGVASATPTPAPTLRPRPAVDNIACQKSTEQAYYHIHAHLTLVINSNPVPIPANVGIAYDSKCLYWLHTHDRSGVIHVESPKRDIYTLGTFLHLWKAQFSNLNYPPELDQSKGWIAYVDGRRNWNDFHNIQLISHRLITLAYHSPDITPDSDFFWGSLTR
ncbi:MAG: hypothetical protein J2P36_09280 [Ktedonobacteraceae bacterium]|nr:hypothetical protein [Ktedonobacteraceae bacterium]